MDSAANTENTIYSFEINDIKGNPVSLESYKGKVILIVNTASACGLTPQYEGLEKLYQQYKDQDFVVLGFPCNQFGGQEPGTAVEIQAFCDTTFSVSFPLFEKIEVNGDGAHPLYQFLKKTAPGVLGSEKIKWNFTKFLINKDGEVVDRFAPTTTPDAIEKEIKVLL